MFQFEQFTTGLSTKPTGLVVQLARHGSLKNCSLDWVVGSTPTWATKRSAHAPPNISVLGLNVKCEVPKGLDDTVVSEG